jgi:hypothetical protein
MSKPSKNIPSTNLFIAYGGSILSPKVLQVFFTNYNTVESQQDDFDNLLEEHLCDDTTGKVFIIKNSLTDTTQKFNELNTKYALGKKYIQCSITDFVKEVKTTFDNDIKKCSNIKHSKNKAEKADEKNEPVEETKQEPPPKDEGKKDSKKKKNKEAAPAEEKIIEPVKEESKKDSGKKKGKNKEPPVEEKIIEPVKEESKKDSGKKKGKNKEPPVEEKIIEPVKEESKKDSGKKKGKNKEPPVVEPVKSNAIIVKQRDRSIYDSDSESESESDDEGVPTQYQKPCESDDDDDDDDDDN